MHGLGSTESILGFLADIGVAVQPGYVADNSFLPGIDVVSGTLVYDAAKMKFPGDLLHEAAHLALAPAKLRPTLSGEVVVPGVQPDVLEAAVIAWSYAAAKHIGIDPRVVFHDGGYFQNAGNILRNFEMGVYLGVTLLEEFGIALTAPTASSRGLKPFPNIIQWLRN